MKKKLLELSDEELKQPSLKMLQWPINYRPIWNKWGWGKESQQINRRYKEEPKGNLGTEKYSNQKKKKKSSVVGLKSRMEEKEEIISDLEGK